MCAGGSKKALLGPKIAKHGRLAEVLRWSMIQNDTIQHVFDHFGPIWTLLDHFRKKLDSLLQITLAKKHFVFLRHFVFLSPIFLAFLPLSSYFCLIQVTISFDNFFLLFITSFDL